MWVSMKKGENDKQEVACWLLQAPTYPRPLDGHEMVASTLKSPTRRAAAPVARAFESDPAP